jgi:hypothetical protein
MCCVNWWRVTAVTEKDGKTREETVYLFRDSPAQALTDGEMSLLATHGEGAELKGAWLYFAGEKAPRSCRVVRE